MNRTGQETAEQPTAALGSVMPILPVRAMARAVAYYRAPGFTARLYADGDDYAFLARDSCELHLRRAPDLIDGQNPSGIYVALASGGAATLEAEFRAAGVPILSPLAVRDWRMNEFVLSDPDGNLLRFGEPALEA